MVIKIKNLNEVMDDLNAIGKVDMKPFIEKSSQKVQRTAKKLAPYDIGDLRRGIKWEVFYENQKIVGSIYNATEYAPYLEFGVKDSVTIYPRNAKALHWKDKNTGKDVFAKRVVIPPRKAQPHMYPALEIHNREIDREARRYIQSKIEEVAK